MMIPISQDPATRNQVAGLLLLRELQKAQAAQAGKDSK